MDAIDPSSYRCDGYLIVRDLLRPDDLAALRGESVALCRGRLGALQGLVESPTSESDADAMRRYMVGVMPHKLPSLFARYLGDERIVRVLNTLIGPDVKGVHSQVFFKAAGAPGNAFHQDEKFIPTRDRSLVLHRPVAGDGGAHRGHQPFDAAAQPSVGDRKVFPHPGSVADRCDARGRAGADFS